MEDKRGAGRPAGESQETVVIAIDGPAGSGKTTVARRLAEHLGFFLLDSGALYRVVALHLMRRGIPADGCRISSEILRSLNVRMEPAIGAMSLYLDGEDVTQSIRTEEIGTAASRYSSRPEVRRTLIGLQRDAGRTWNLVAEGRDMGSVVFPDSRMKFFLTADLAERARRRYAELLERGVDAQLSVVRAEMLERDTRDESRSEAPLLRAPDAILVDTGGLSVEQVLQAMMLHVDMCVGSGIDPL